MSVSITSLCLVLAMVCLAALADIRFRQAEGFLTIDYAVATALYALCGVPTYFVLKLRLWGWVTIAWTVMHVALGLTIALWIYGEAFTWRRAASVLALVVAAALAE